MSRIKPTDEELERLTEIRDRINELSIRITRLFAEDHTPPTIAELACLQVVGVSMGARGENLPLGRLSLSILERGWKIGEKDRFKYGPEFE